MTGAELSLIIHCCSLLSKRHLPCSKQKKSTSAVEWYEDTAFILSTVIWLLWCPSPIMRTVLCIVSELLKPPTSGETPEMRTGQPLYPKWWVTWVWFHWIAGRWGWWWGQGVCASHSCSACKLGWDRAGSDMLHFPRHSDRKCHPALWELTSSHFLCLSVCSSLLLASCSV